MAFAVSVFQEFAIDTDLGLSSVPVRVNDTMPLWK